MDRSRTDALAAVQLNSKQIQQLKLSGYPRRNDRNPDKGPAVPADAAGSTGADTTKDKP